MTAALPASPAAAGSIVWGSPTRIRAVPDDGPWEGADEAAADPRTPSRAGDEQKEGPAAHRPR
jgi:hypothetical protein